MHTKLVGLAITTAQLPGEKHGISTRQSAAEQVQRLGAISRLLLQVEAIHAVSWLWPGDAPFVSHAAKWTTTAETIPTTGTLSSAVLSTVRWTPGTNRLFLGALFRYAVMMLLLYVFGDGCTSRFCYLHTKYVAM